MSSSARGEVIKKLQRGLPRGRPIRSEDLAAFGVYPELAYRYVKSGWLEKLGRGVFQFSGDTLGVEASLATLGVRMKGFHVGGKTALAWQGYRQNLGTGQALTLWAAEGGRIPGWFTERFPSRLTCKSLFDEKIGRNIGLRALPEHPEGVQVSEPERALLELLSEVGVHEEADEARQIMETIRTPRERVLLELLGACKQAKTLRLCVVWSRELGLPWAGAVHEATVGRIGSNRWVGRTRNGKTLILKP